MPSIALALTDAEIMACLPVMQELRPHLTEAGFLTQIQRMQAGGFYLAALRAKGEVRAVAGFRLEERLVKGRLLYVDDLVTAADSRSLGYGKQLLSWLIAHARSQDCRQLQLDSGVHRFAAHRFYMREGMHISAHHFELMLE